MTKMALILSANSWNKVENYQQFVKEQSPACWPSEMKFTERYLNQLDIPLNLYFSVEDTIRYRARCVAINKLPCSSQMVPEEYQDDLESFETFFHIQNLEEVSATAVSDFPAWKEPEPPYKAEEVNLMRVVDILAK